MWGFTSIAYIIQPVTQQILILIFGLAIGVTAAWFILRRRSSSDSSFHQLEQALAARLETITAHIERRLSDNVHAINESKSFITSQLNHSERTARDVSAGLGKLEQATAALQRTNQEISSFQNMLKHPKIRGGFGEVLLGNLLADVLPHDRYQLQYTFPGVGDIADAIILLQDGYKVAVDAKFPLANYQLMVNADDDLAKKNMRSAFFRDIKKHIHDISTKYIVPQARTLDYAFMYIPVEAVYYETMIHDHDEETLWEFCLQHKVIPVSPNSLLAYLQTVLVGLRGMKVEKQAKEILEHIGQIRQDFGQFTKDFAMIGSHLNNAKNRYDDSARRLDKFSNRLEHIETVGDKPLPPTAPPSLEQ